MPLRSRPSCSRGPQQIVEELHIQLIVLHIRTVLASPKPRAPQASATDGMRTESPCRPAIITRKLVRMYYGKQIAAHETASSRPREARKCWRFRRFPSSQRPGAARRLPGRDRLTIERIRAAARQSDFLAGVLEHMLGDESLLLAFADSAGIGPARLPEPALRSAGHGSATCRELELLPAIAFLTRRRNCGVARLRLAAAAAPRRTRGAVDRPRRLRCLLRHDRETRRSIARDGTGHCRGGRRGVVAAACYVAAPSGQVAMPMFEALRLCRRPKWFGPTWKNILGSAGKCDR